jgi:hypothetical protein
MRIPRDVTGAARPEGTCAVRTLDKGESERDGGPPGKPRITRSRVCTRWRWLGRSTQPPPEGEQSAGERTPPPFRDALPGAGEGAAEGEEGADERSPAPRRPSLAGAFAGREAPLDLDDFHASPTPTPGLFRPYVRPCRCRRPNCRPEGQPRSQRFLLSASRPRAACRRNQGVAARRVVQSSRGLPARGRGAGVFAPGGGADE